MSTTTPEAPAQQAIDQELAAAVAQIKGAPAPTETAPAAEPEKPPEPKPKPAEVKPEERKTENPKAKELAQNLARERALR